MNFTPVQAERVREDAHEILVGKKTVQEVVESYINRGYTKEFVVQGLSYWGIQGDLK